jgi:pSer/pThr/pTyr-binding forkhead associated (FHA) protein
LIAESKIMPILSLKLKGKKIGDYQLQKGVSLTIGRRRINNVTINDLAVSGHHAKIDSVGDGFVLIDLQSKNGSFVNEQLINSHWLKHGDTINIGEHSLVFNYPEYEEIPGEDTENLERTIVLDTSQYRNRMKISNPTRSIINVAGFWDKPQSRGKFQKSLPENPRDPTNEKKDPVGSLIFLAGGNGAVSLNRKFTTIGKHPASDIVVGGWLMGQTAATISKLPDGFHLCFVSGFTKPKVNKKAIKQSTILKHKDVICIGSMKLQFTNENFCG